jgi:hypothetical protein
MDLPVMSHWNAIDLQHAEVRRDAGYSTSFSKAVCAFVHALKGLALLRVRP